MLSDADIAAGRKNQSCPGEKLAAVQQYTEEAKQRFGSDAAAQNHKSSSEPNAGKGKNKAE